VCDPWTQVRVLITLINEKLRPYYHYEEEQAELQVRDKSGGNSGGGGGGGGDDDDDNDDHHHRHKRNGDSHDNVTSADHADQREAAALLPLRGGAGRAPGA
jgi:hypothetical protein